MFRVFSLIGVEWQIKDSPDVLRDPVSGELVGTLRDNDDHIVWVAPDIEGKVRDLAIATAIAAIVDSVLVGGGFARLVPVSGPPLS